MNTEQLKNYIDILYDDIMFKLDIIMTMEMQRCKEEKPSLLGDLQAHLNNTKRKDFNAFLKEDKAKKRQQQRHDAYAEFFATPKNIRKQ